MRWAVSIGSGTVSHSWGSRRYGRTLPDQLAVIEVLCWDPGKSQHRHGLGPVVHFVKQQLSSDAADGRPGPLRRWTRQGIIFLHSFFWGPVRTPFSLGVAWFGL